MYRQEKWDRRFLKLAEFISTFSKDPSTKVGAVIVRDVNRIVSVGYNGFDKQDPDLDEHYSDRSIKYPKIIHAERNAINWAGTNGYFNLNGCTIYTTPFPPCDSDHAGGGCTDLIIEQGMSRIVSYNPTEEQIERWGDSLKSSRKKIEMHGVELVLYRKKDEET
jgi:dCMP deaminase